MRRQIARKELAIITQFYADGTYLYDLVYQHSARPFPAYHEVGTWKYDPARSQIACIATNQKQSSLPLATVKQLTRNLLVVEIAFDGENAGIVETLYHRRFDELK